MTQPCTLYVFSGLPGVGKSTLAQQLAIVQNTAYLRIDTVEQGLRDLCGHKVVSEGYSLSYRIAADNLRLGQSVVADSCNPLEITRQSWAACSHTAGARHIDIEVVCSDVQEHRQRVETRDSTVAGLELPLWTDVVDREFHEWPSSVIRIDTAGRDVADCMAELLAAVAAVGS